MLKTIRKKVVELKAIQFDGTYKCMYYISNVFKTIETVSASFHAENNIVYHWKINSKINDDRLYINEGDYVIKDSHGLFYVVNEKEFNETYEIIKEK